MHTYAYTTVGQSRRYSEMSGDERRLLEAFLRIRRKSPEIGDSRIRPEDFSEKIGEIGENLQNRRYPEFWILREKLHFF